MTDSTDKREFGFGADGELHDLEWVGMQDGTVIVLDRTAIEESFRQTMRGWRFSR